jgi:exopolysaccharide biosynthesis polyprenyl glycosylphosphotransferase
LADWSFKVTPDLGIRSEPAACLAPALARPLPRLGGRPVHPKRNVLIIGHGPAGRELASYFKEHPLAGFRVRGFLDEAEPAGEEVLGRIANLVEVARANFVDEVILTAPYEREFARRVVQEARQNRLAVKVVPELFGSGPETVALDWVGSTPVLQLHREPLPTWRLFLKRAADVVASGFGLVLALPLMILIGLCIKLDSPGPVLYGSRRLGKKGQTFICHKFRTMIPGAEHAKQALRTANERHGPTFKLAQDPRVTTAGRWLRRYSLDELPQLWNVLRGEMSLVGPRPHPLDDCERYALDHLRRLDVTPGMTGLWQVTARNDPSFQRSLALDMEYIEHWSLGLDLRILWKTVFSVVRGSGS